MSTVNFVVYDKNGNILRTGKCPKKMLLLQAIASKEESVIEGIANDIKQKIANKEKE